MKYFIVTVIALIAWFLSAVVFGGYMEAEVTLESMEIDEYMTMFQFLSAGLTIFTVIFSVFWLYHGSRHKVLADMGKAKSVWVSLLLALVVESFGAVIYIILMTMGEGVDLGLLLLTALVFLIQSAGSYWGATLFFSPVNVKYLPWLSDKVHK